MVLQSYVKERYNKILNINSNDYRNPVIAEAMKVLGYVNRFNRGINMVQEILEKNKNGDAIFDFKDISTFKVTVMNADSILGNDTESGIDGTEKSEKSRRK
jgi:ATP-dependent DNA helicase RecG